MTEGIASLIWWPAAAILLVVHRITRFIVVDTMIDGWRSWLERKAFTGDGRYKPVCRQATMSVTQGQRVAEVPAAHQIRWLGFARGKFADMVLCGFCLSFWIAGATLAVWNSTCGTWSGWGFWSFLFAWWALAGAEVVIWKVVE